MKYLSILRFSVFSSVRDPALLFWGMLFPMMMFMIFSSAFSGSPPLRVYAEGIQIPEGFARSDELHADVILKREGNELIALVRTPPSMDGKVWLLLRKVEMNLLAGGKPRVRVERIKVGSEPKYKEFFLTGMMALSVFSTGMFESIRILCEYRDAGVLRFISVLPIDKNVAILVMILSSSITGLAGASLIWALGGAFGMKLIFSWKVIASILAGWGIAVLTGITIAVLVKDTRTASGIGSLIYFISGFFSGVYFPVDFLPKSFRWISSILPTTYVVDIIRNVFHETLGR